LESGREKKSQSYWAKRIPRIYKNNFVYLSGGGFKPAKGRKENSRLEKRSNFAVSEEKVGKKRKREGMTAGI